MVLNSVDAEGRLADDKVLGIGLVERACFGTETRDVLVSPSVVRSEQALGKERQSTLFVSTIGQNMDNPINCRIFQLGLLIDCTQRLRVKGKYPRNVADPLRRADNQLVAEARCPPDR